MSAIMILLPVSPGDSESASLTRVNSVSDLHSGSVSAAGKARGSTRDAEARTQTVTRNLKALFSNFEVDSGSESGESDPQPEATLCSLSRGRGAPARCTTAPELQVAALSAPAAA
eukprot:1543910-Rhodomonas_salina.2